jgi:hypothetical protein
MLVIVFSSGNKLSMDEAGVRASLTQRISVDHAVMQAIDVFPMMLSERQLFMQGMAASAFDVK